jgi:hypothetical protein
MLSTLIKLAALKNILNFYGSRKSDLPSDIFIFVLSKMY